MGVSYETMIQKMLEELQQAKLQKSEQEMKKHINHVKLLCDLILENKSATTSHASGESVDDLTEEEMIAMLGSNRVKKQERKKTSYHQETDGDSIFDF